MSQPGGNARITQLDGLRGLAVVMVFLHHAFVLKFLWMGVDIFFVLSGFLITDILIRNRGMSLGSYIRNFYGKRVRRILPPYILLLIVSSLAFGTAWLHHWYLYLGLMNYRELLGSVHHESLSPLWSLAIEEQFYFFWPFVVYFLSDRWLARVAVLLIVLAPIARYVYTAVYHPSYYFSAYEGTLFRMDLLAAGALIAVLWKHRRAAIVASGRYGALLAACGVACIPVAQRFLHVARLANTPRSNTVLYEETLLIAVGIFWWALSGWRVGWLKLTPLRYMGKISYSVYLIQILFLLVFGQHFGMLATAILSGAATLAYSELSWRFMEKPLIATGYRRKIVDLTPGADSPAAMTG